MMRSKLFFCILLTALLLLSSNSAMALMMRTTVSGTLTLIDPLSDGSEINYIEHVLGLGVGDNMELFTVDYDNESTSYLKYDGSSVQTYPKPSVYEFISNATIRFSPILSNIILAQPGNVVIDPSDIGLGVTQNVVYKRLDDSTVNPGLIGLLVDSNPLYFISSWYNDGYTTETLAHLEIENSRNLYLSWNTTSQSTTTEAPVPEPATMVLLGTGLVGIAGIGRKKFFKK